MKLFTAVVVLSALCASAGLSTTEAPISQLLVQIDSPDDLERLSRIVSVGGYDGHHAVVTVVPEQLRRLRQDGWVFEEQENHKTENVEMCSDGWDQGTPPDWSCFPTYDQYEALLARLADEHSDICRLVDLGPTNNLVNPHRLLALKITERPDAEEAEPEVFLTATMHGDETTGYLTLLRLAYNVLETADENPRIAEILAGTELWINPLANPDGTYYGGNQTVASAIRFATTESGGYSAVDLNRNFPDPRAGAHPDGQPWWPETEAMMQFAQDHTITLSANLHDGAEVINYPWDTWCERHPDDDWWYELSLDWASTAQQLGPIGYMSDCFTPACGGGSCTPGVTNGADWYMVAGGRQDFMTYFHGAREVTAEISSVKLRPASEVQTLWNANRAALLQYVEAAQNGIHGVVTDRQGSPLAASVSVVAHDTHEAGSAVHTDPDVGDFHRLLLPGVYDLKVSAPGFRTTYVNGVLIVPNEPAPQLQIELDNEIGPIERLVGIAPW